MNFLRQDCSSSRGSRRVRRGRVRSRVVRVVRRSRVVRRAGRRVRRCPSLYSCRQHAGSQQERSCARAQCAPLAAVPP
jgi:hypothetical protein